MKEEEKICPKCKSHYRGKVYVLNFADKDFVEGKIDKPPIVETQCHGIHPEEP